jgi:two-component system chemotaxis response regulator CheB
MVALRMATASSQRDIVAIGGSAGGLRQIRVLLELLPSDLPAIVLVVLHRPGDQVSYLREVLASKSRMPVVEAIHGQELLVATCYLGQPSEHLEVDELLRAKLLSDPRMSRRGRTIDGLFGSLAHHAGPRTIGVVLSGALRDGAKGLAEIKQAGGIIMVQSPGDAEFESMPESAIAHDGIVDVIAPTAELARAIERYVYGLEQRHECTGRNRCATGDVQGENGCQSSGLPMSRERPTACRHVVISPQSGSGRKRGIDGQET